MVWALRRIDLNQITTGTLDSIGIRDRLKLPICVNTRAWWLSSDQLVMEIKAMATEQT